MLQSNLRRQRNAAVCQAGDDASRYQTGNSTQEITGIKSEQKKLLLLLLLLLTTQPAQTTSPVTRLIQPRRHPVAAVDLAILMTADVISITSWWRSTAAGHLQGVALFCFLEPGRVAVGSVLHLATTRLKRQKSKATRGR